MTIGDLILERFCVDAAFEGGLGVLYAVTDVVSGRRYAVKATRPDLRGDPAVSERFREEARTWIALDKHDHLVQAFWLVDDAYLVLELVDGRDLAALLADGPLPVERAIDLAMQCAAGLAYAHGKRLAHGVGVVHRDIKPKNLLVTADDLLKITDFGLARVTAAEGEVSGTPAYMAPEQLREGHAADGRSDIYSFGLVVHEMVAGVCPLRADDLAGQVERTLHEAPPRLLGVPAPLAALVHRCLAKSPAERPRDIPEVLAHLAQVAATMEHPFHIDPQAIAAPSRPAGLVLEPVALRPRRPRAGEPFAVELRVAGDVGAGSVDVAWSLEDAGGLEVLTPRARTGLRVEAGGTVDLTLRLSLLADREGAFRVGKSLLQVAGETHAVPAFEAPVRFAFVLPLVGRDEEMETLRRLVAAGRGLRLFSGDVGTGKTRLLSECARLAEEAGMRAVRTRATRLRPMRVLSDVAREVLGLSRGEVSAVRAAVYDLLGDEPRAARYFADLLLSHTPLEQDVPSERHWFALLSAAARRQPLALLLDDLHLADEAVRRIVDDIAARADAADSRLLIVGTTDRRGSALGPLARGDVERLVDAAFEGHGFREEAPWLVETIVRVTRGNPFHVFEILRTLRLGPGEAIARRDGEWRLAPDLSPERLRGLVPGALEAAVRQRLAGLPAESHEVLFAAALAGEEFDAAVVREALGDPARVEAGLAEMESAGILRQVEDRELDRYRFWNASVPEVVRKTLPRSSSRRLHQAVARGMLAVYRGERRLRRSLAIAHHLRGAGQAQRALPFTLAGCRRLLGMQLGERARRLLANVEAFVDDEHRALFDYLYGIASTRAGEYDAGHEALTRFVEAEVGIEGDPRSLPRAYTLLGRIHQARGDYERARQCFAVALERLKDLGDRRATAFLLASMGELALDRKELAAAGSHIEDAHRVAEETGNEGAAIQSLILRGRLSLALDRPARRDFADAERRARELGDRRRRAAALEGLGRAALRGGYLQEAEKHIRAGLELQARMGDRAGLAIGLVRLGEVWRASGCADKALRSYRRAQRVFEEIRHHEGVAAARHRAGLVLRGWGKTTAAVRELAASTEGYARLRLPDRFDALHDLGQALADAGSERASRLALARADRGAASRDRRVRSRTIRARLAAVAGNLRRAKALAASALRLSARAPGHESRIAAQQTVGEIALLRGELAEARSAADAALCYARQEGDLLARAAAERILLELAARAGRREEARGRAHRIARAYTGRADAGADPARLLLSLGRGLGRTDPSRARGYLRAARRCFGRLQAQGLKAPEIE